MFGPGLVFRPPCGSWHSAQSRMNDICDTGVPWPAIPMCVCALDSVWFTLGSFRWHASHNPVVAPEAPYWFPGSPVVPYPLLDFQLLSNVAPPVNFVLS